MGISGRSGGSSRRTSAPWTASVRVATGPAITRVRSSTRGRSAARGGAAPSRRSSTSGGAGAPASVRHRCRVRTAAPTPPCVVQRRLQLDGMPAGHGRRHGVGIVGTAENPQRRGPVPRVVRVQAQPAVGGAVERGQRVERGARLLPADPQVPLAAQRDGEAPGVDAHLGAGAEGGGEQARAHGGHRGRGHRQDRPQRGVGAADQQPVGLACRSAQLGPHLSKQRRHPGEPARAGATVDPCASPTSAS